MSLASPVVANRAELESVGWDVRAIEGLDRMQAMQAPVVVPILRSLRGSIA